MCDGRALHTPIVNICYSADYLYFFINVTNQDFHKFFFFLSKTVDMRLMLPHFVYLCVTNDLNTVAQSLVRRLRQSETADSLFRDESLEEDQEHMYINNRSSELLEGNEESTEEGQAHEYANYRSLELFEANNEVGYFITYV